MTRGGPAARPRRLVLLGHPVAHSLSPPFQDAALAAAGLELRYEALDVPPRDLAVCLEELRKVQAAGNVTIPHKRAVFALCGIRTPLADRVGSVNSFWHSESGELVGDNTDVGGFERAVDSLGVRRQAARVLCLGSGGAAAAVCAAVASWPGATLALLARNNDLARSLALRGGPAIAVMAPDAPEVVRATLVVNATPLGLNDNEQPLELDRLAGDACVMDFVYRPGLTAWVRAARRRGHTAIDGREMLLQQGALAFESWLGMMPDIAVMRRALESALAL